MSSDDVLSWYFCSNEQTKAEFLLASCDFLTPYPLVEAWWLQCYDLNFEEKTQKV